jgi:pyruvate dehydrogenase E2 component (dihydrolipoamide acetyltransferase)
MAEENNIDLTTITGTGPRGRITKGDVEAAMSQPAPTAPTTNGGGKVELAYGKVPASPAARRVAAELGVDLTTVTGSGPGGRIQGDDVRAAAQSAPAAAAAPAAAQAPSQPAQPAAPAAAPAETEVVPLKGMRKRIAQRMQASFRDAPHIFFDATVDMRGIRALRQRIKAQDAKLSVTSVIVKACAWTLMQHPMMNATFDGENITLWNTANVGVAVALENGLIVPVVRSAETLSLRQIQQQVTDLAGRARDGKLTPDDMQGGTFSVSNLGMFGVDRFTAIVNPPQVGIVAVGRTVEQFVPDDNGEPVLRPQMNITVSADHRVVDGAQVAQFIGDLRDVLEDPMLLAW